MGFRAHSGVFSDAGTSLKPKHSSRLTVDGRCYLDQCERHGDHAQEEVGHGQVGDEHVPVGSNEARGDDDQYDDEYPDDDDNYSNIR